MYRNLHITIHEAGRPGQQPGGTAAYPGGTWNPEGHEQVIPDPNNPEGHEQVIPDPNNPEAREQVIPDPNNPEAREQVIPDPNNPEAREQVIPDPNNPEGHEQVIPDPNNPTGGYWLQGGPGAYGPAASVYEGGGSPAPVCCCPCDGKVKAPQRPGAGPGDYSGFVIVRLAAGIPLDVRTLWELAQRPEFAALKAVLELPDRPPEGGEGSGLRVAAASSWREPAPDVRRVLVSRPLVEPPWRPGYGAPLNRAETVTAIQELERRARKTSFAPLSSLAGYFRVDLRPYPELLEEAVERFNALPEVDLAYRELVALDPGTAPGTSLAEDQGYLHDAPTGIGASAVWKYLGRTGGVTVCDLEQGWHTEHMEIQAQIELPLFFGANREIDEPGQGHHGTAVMGQLTAAGSGPFAVQGVSSGAGRFTLASHYRSLGEEEPDDTGDAVPHPFAGTRGHVAAAIVNTLVDLITPAGSGPKPLLGGDVLLIEVQRGRLPTEVDAADFDAVRLASALEVVVVEAAGNGGLDLDRYVDPDTGRGLSRRVATFRDSGAIFVGASRAALPHDRAGFSNYGSRLDCYAWGEAVTSCGYGDLGGDLATEYYTNTFSGTSSASPIIAGAAALVQRLREAGGAAPLRPRAMRALLSDPATGTRQGPGVAGFIGIMPDLGKVLRGRLQLVSDVYMRSWIGDDGARPLPPGAPISSSPDIIPRGLPVSAADTARLKDDLDGAYVPAPGAAVAPGPARLIYLRLRNRGGAGENGVRVELFASPAATLITPEWWTRLPLDPSSPEKATLVDVPHGDRSVLSDPPVPWTPPDYQPGGGAPTGDCGYSFLAVQRPAAAAGSSWPVDRSDGLPPGPPYFDWAEYRKFLRGPGVAWRNVHRVRIGGQVPAQLPSELPAQARGHARLGFFFAGTPDRARAFDFEILQRLPGGMQAILTVPGPFGAKLRQRQSAVSAGESIKAWDDFRVQPSPRTPLGRVELPAGARVWAVLTLQTPDQSPPTRALEQGDSIAIRQLWKGEEVGRITWWFVT